MSKAIASYPDHMREHVVQRRMRQYNPKGPNGMGVLAAKAQYDRTMGKRVSVVSNLIGGAAKAMQDFAEAAGGTKKV